MSQPFVLSLFPGIGLLDMAFEEEGFCVVRGPDVLWGGDIRRFHPPSGVFQGLIGGPPCQSHTNFAALAKHQGRTVADDLIPEFERVVGEAAPIWFLMENSRHAPMPRIFRYGTHRFVMDNRWLGETQHRERSWSFGRCAGSTVDLRPLIAWPAFEAQEWSAAILASGGVKPGLESKRGRRPGREYGYTGKDALAIALKQQGLPEEFLADAPFTAEGKFRVVGNGVPLPMGRAIARAVKRAMGYEAAV